MLVGNALGVSRVSQDSTEKGGSCLSVFFQEETEFSIEHVLARVGTRGVVTGRVWLEESLFVVGTGQLFSTLGSILYFMEPR